MDEELIGQRRDISGDAFITCDLCGLPHAAATVLVVSGRRPSGEPVDAVRACPGCRAMIDRDDAPFDAVSDAVNTPLVERG